MDKPYTKYPRSVLWLLRGGRFALGGPGPDERPRRELELPPFYIGTTVVTNVQYEAFDPAHERSAASAGDDDPVTGVSYREALGYCAWYARVARKPIRLPTEDEWERACRGPSVARYPWGDDPAGHAGRAWLAENAGGRCHAAQSLEPNGEGLYGTIGNVWEWALACGEDGPPVLRGGSFRTPAREAGCAVRRAAGAGLAGDDVGFRIVREFSRGGPV